MSEIFEADHTARACDEGVQGESIQWACLNTVEVRLDQVQFT
jgi:hypothetical protein